MYVQKIPWEVNYDESQMPQYTLPDVLLCQDGSKIETADAWQKKRRPELLQMFKDVMYGEIPPRPDRVRYEMLSEKKDARGGKAVRREVRIHLEMNSGKSHSIDMLYYIPANAKGKVPVFVGLTFVGNHVITAEQDVRITGPVRLGKHVRRFDRHQHMIILIQDTACRVSHAATSRSRRRAARRPS